MKRRARVSGWRRLMRVVLALGLLLAIPLIAWFIWNRIDEPPSAAALNYSAPPDRSVVDADNAWLALIGIGAAEDDDPIVLGRRRVDALHARYARSPVPEADAAELALFTDAVAAVEPDATLDQGGTYCPARDFDCLDWTAHHRAMLWRLREANALRLQRYAKVLRMPGWQMLYPPSHQMPFVDTDIARLDADLVALDLAHSLNGKASDALAALDRLADSVGFWSRVRSEPQDLVSIVLAGRRIEHAYWITAAWLNKAPSEQIEAASSQLDRILAVQPAPDWEQPLRIEYQIFVNSLRDATPGPLEALRQCFSGSEPAGTAKKDGCLFSLAMSAAYAPQATNNLHAANFEQIQRALETTPRTSEAVMEDVGNELSAALPPLDDASAMLPWLAFNFTGRVLAAIAIPAFDYHRREWDRESLRRIVLASREARRQQVAASEVAAFLQQLSATWHDLDAEYPVSWDAAREALYFAPRADKHWARERVELAYHEPDSAGIDACEDPIGFELFDAGDEDNERQDLRFFSCGKGNEPYWQSVMDDDPFAIGRYEAISLRRAGEQFEVSVWRASETFRLAYHAWIEPDASGFDQVLEPVDVDVELDLRMRSIPAPAPSLVRINVANMSARDIVRRIAAVEGLDIAGQHRLQDSRLTLNFELPPREVLELIADDSGLMLRERGPSGFEFVPTQ